MERTVDVLGVHLEPMSGDSIVLLGERNEVTHVVPIFIGSAEARSIVMGVAGLTPPRPNTHDLMNEVMALTGVSLQAVVVTQLIGGTFHAELELETTSGRQRVDCRPSDGIALAVRADAPIRVDDAVFVAASVEVEHEEDAAFSDEQIESIVSEFHDYLRTAEPEDFVLDPEEQTKERREAQGDDPDAPEGS